MNKIKYIAPVLIALVGLGLQQAQATMITATTSGNFSVTNSPNYGNLAFTNGSFSVNTVGGNATISGADLTHSLGRFVLSNGTFTYTGSFTLTVTFTAPFNGGTPFTATITGETHGNGVDEDVVINFGGIQQVNYTGGSFSLLVNDVTFTDQGTRFVSGSITQEQTTGVPDGGSAVALLGLALTGLEVVRRKLRTS